MATRSFFGTDGSRQRLLGLGLIAIIVVLVGGAFLYSSVRATTPGDDSAEAGFLRDMQVHHVQAVEMAIIIRDRTEDEQIFAMATDIAFSQTSQIGTMIGFLDIWDLNPTGDGPAMAWMGHPVEGLMPGMATAEEVNKLRTLPIDQAEVLFMQLMNRHHIAGVDMAQGIIDRSDQEEVVTMAESMVRVQSAEIEIMNQMLVERGAEPITTVDAEVLSDNGATPAAGSTAEDHGH